MASMNRSRDRIGCLETIRASELELMNGEQVDQTAQANNSADAGSESAEE